MTSRKVVVDNLNDLMTDYRIENDDNIWNLFNSFDSDKPNEVKEKPIIIETVHIDSCFHCNSKHLILDEGNYVCLDCGTLFERFIDTAAEWRYYGHEDSKMSDPTRCGLPTNDLLPDSSLGTIIGNKNGECYEMRILRKYQMWNSMTYKERTLYNIFDTLTINAVNSGIPSTIIDEAKNLYKKLSELKLSRGDNRAGLIASSIYMSCKTHNVPRSAKEIADIFNLKTTVMNKGCKKFQEILKLELASSNASDFILRFCSKLNLDREIKDISLYVVNKADELNITSESSPVSLAAGAIYLVCIISKTEVIKKEMAAATNVSMVTISKCYKKLFNYRKYILPDEVLEKYNVN
jgi:transcription initiation factor TFIIB